MTFKKNFLALFCATLLLVIGSYLVGIARDVFIAGMTMWIAGSVVTLAMEDLFRKLGKDRDKLTWQYFVGFALVLLAVVSFLWASESMVLIENLYRLGIAVFFAFLGGIWFSTIYRRSVMDKEARYQEAWDGTVKKIAKAKTQEAKYSLIAKTLRYHLIGDSLGGLVDFDHPLAEFNDSYLTIEEITGEVDAEAIEDEAVEYAKSLIKEVE